MKIEINNIPHFIPEKFEDLTFGQYERLADADLNDEPTIVSIFLDCPVELIYDFPVSAYNKIVLNAAEILQNINLEGIKAKNEVEIDGVRYTINYGEELTLAEYIDTRDAGLGDILSVVLRPYGEKYDAKKCEERKRLFEKQPVGKMLPLISFFIKKRAGYYQDIRYSLLLQQAQTLCVNSIKNFQETFGLFPFSTLLRILKLKIMIRLSKWNWGQHFLYYFLFVRKMKPKEHKKNMKNN